MRLHLVSPPAVEPVTLADAKAFLRLEITDDDALVTGLITAARLYVETALKQALITQSWLLYLDGFPTAGGYYNPAVRQVWAGLGSMPTGLGFYPGLVPNSTGVIAIPNPPLQSIDSVKYWDFQGNLQTVSPSSYVVSLDTPARIQPQYSQVWPVSRPTIDAVQIQFTAGYGSDGTKVPANILIAIKMLVNHWYEHREAVSETGLGEVPLAVNHLLGASEHGAYG